MRKILGISLETPHAVSHMCTYITPYVCPTHANVNIIQTMKMTNHSSTKPTHGFILYSLAYTLSAIHITLPLSLRRILPSLQFVVATSESGVQCVLALPH